MQPTIDMIATHRTSTVGTGNSNSFPDPLQPFPAVSQSIKWFSMATHTSSAEPMLLFFAYAIDIEDTCRLFALVNLLAAHMRMALPVTTSYFCSSTATCVFGHIQLG